MKKNKEHKKGESTIGKIIYGFLLFMPLFAIGITCGYAMFNKNAYKSYEDTLQTTENVLTNYNEFVEGKNYEIVYKQYATSTYDYSPIIRYTNINIDWVDYGANNSLTYNGFRIRTNDNLIQLYVDGASTTNVNLFNVWGISLTDFTFTFLSSDAYNNMPLINNNTILYFTTINNTIDNVFYNAVDKVTESPLFSWTTNSVIYTTMNATCTQLSITTPFIPLLLTYWLIISVIYFLYDIALMLIWLLHDKIHEIRDSLA